MYKVQREFDMLGLVVNYVCVWGGGGGGGGGRLGGGGGVLHMWQVFYVCCAPFVWNNLSTVLGDFEALSVFKHNANLRRICLG